MAAFPMIRMRNSVLLLLVSLSALSGISPVRIQGWFYDINGFSKQTELQDLEILLPSISGDLDGDGIPESISILNGMAVIMGENGPAWHSPESWQVKQAILADLNRDSRLEAVLLVWREFHPWPVDRFLPNGGRIAGFQNTKGQSCHLILIGWKKNGYGELWAGSALAEPLLKVDAVDIRGNGETQLVALESGYNDPPGIPARAFSAWEWNGFGFSLVRRAKGEFRQMQVVMMPGHQPAVLLQE
jgi:hypothetical protein